MSARWLALFALGGACSMGLVSSCGIDPSLTCGDQCGDATLDVVTNPDAPNTSDGGGNDGVVNDAPPPADSGADQAATDAQIGGLDANCHSADSSTPQLACPATGCCPFGGQNYSCNSAGQCCRNNGSFCGQGSPCCGACTNSGGGNGACASSCVSQNGACGQSSDCCLNTWCKNNSCAACTQQGSPCTSSYECCYNYACQSNGDGGKTCQGN